MEIGSTSTIQTESPPATNTLEQAGLDRDAFLRLFIAQLEHQDPLNPQSSTELSSQLAQFAQFEQSLRMVGELEGVNRRLDDLIEANGETLASLNDPLTLLGRVVEFEGDVLRVPDSGPSEPLRFTVAADTGVIGILVRDSQGDVIGQTVLTPVSSFVTPGTYELTLGEEARLRTPSGASGPLQFNPAELGEGGVQIIPGEPLSFEPGRAYRFSIDANRDGRLVALEPTTTGTVEAVRTDLANPVVVVNGEELELTQIIHVR